MRRTFDRVDALVLAGGINRIPLYEGYEPGFKALLPFHGQPAVHYTLSALRGVAQVGRIGLVGPEADLRGAIGDASGPLEFVPGGDTLVGSIVAGLRHFADSPMVLVATADLPLLTAGAVADFLAACSCAEAAYPESFYLSVVPKPCFTGAWAATQKDFSQFRDTAVSHGNLFLADPRILRNDDAMGRINGMYGARKNAVRSAMAIGWRVGVSYVVGVRLLQLLTMERMARIASWRFGVDILPVVVEHPAIAVDVDEPADYAFVSAELAKAAPAPAGD